MKSRKIQYADPDEDHLQTEVELALKRTMEARFKAYCDTIAALYAMSGIDVVNYPVKRVISFKEDE